MSISNFHNTSFAKLTAWLLIVGLMLPACAEMVNTPELPIDNESFLDKAAKVGTQYGSSAELFQSILNDIKARENQAKSPEFKIQVQEFQKFTNSANADLRKKENASANARFNRTDLGSSDVDIMMKSVAARNPLGQDFFYKMMAIGDMVLSENPELLGKSEAEIKAFVDQHFGALVAKHISDVGIADTNPCNLICYENFVVQSTFASIVLATALGGCGLTGAFAQTCVILSAGIYAIQYSIELGYLWSCVEKCTTDVISVG
jgi:hypothetical protein